MISPTLDNIRGMTTEEKEKLRSKYQQEYGFSSLGNWQVVRILESEEELAECKNCSGEPCKKGSNQYLSPKIQNVSGELWIPYAPCKWGEVRSLRGKFKHSQIPPKYFGKTFDDYKITIENNAAVTGARWLAKNKSWQGLYLYGDTGTGKTFLSALIAKEYISALKSVVFGDVPTLLAELRATFDKGGTEQLLDRYCNCDLLVLDDLGAGQMTDWSVGVIYQIVNSRYNAEKTTIATSNYDLRNLCEVLSPKDSVVGKRITSRLREMTFQCFLGTNDRR